jgi:hypothetical protein
VALVSTAHGKETSLLLGRGVSGGLCRGGRNRSRGSSRCNNRSGRLLLSNGSGGGGRSDGLLYHLGFLSSDLCGNLSSSLDGLASRHSSGMVSSQLIRLFGSVPGFLGSGNLTARLASPALVIRHPVVDDRLELSTKVGTDERVFADHREILVDRVRAIPLKRV